MQGIARLLALGGDDSKPLLVDGFDAEQVWEQLNDRNKALLEQMKEQLPPPPEPEQQLTASFLKDYQNFLDQEMAEGLSSKRGGQLGGDDEDEEDDEDDEDIDLNQDIPGDDEDAKYDQFFDPSKSVQGSPPLLPGPGCSFCMVCSLVELLIRLHAGRTTRKRPTIPTMTASRLWLRRTGMTMGKANAARMAARRRRNPMRTPSSSRSRRWSKVARPRGGVAWLL